MKIIWNGLKFIALLTVLLYAAGCYASRSATIEKEKQASAVVDGEKPELVLQYTNTERPLDLAFAAHAPVFAVNNNGSIDIWDIKTWTLLRTIDVEPQEYRNYLTVSIALSPNGKLLAYMTSNGEVQIWNTESSKLERTLPEPVGLPVGIAWSPSGQMIAAGGTTSARLWDATSGKVIHTFRASGSVAFSANGRILGIADKNDAAIFDTITGHKIRSFSDKVGASWPIAISPNGKYVATGGEDPNWDPGPLPKDEEGNEYAPTESFYSHMLKVKIWDIHTGKRIRMLEGYNNLDGGALFLQFAPDSRRLFISGYGGLAIWDVKTGRRIRNYECSNPCTASPDGSMVALAQSTVTVYNVKTGKKLTRFRFPPLPIKSVAFSPDGNILAAGDQSASSTSLRLWNTKKGCLQRAFNGPPSDLKNVGFLSDKVVFSSGLNGNFVWNSDTGKLMAKYYGPEEKSFIGAEKRWALLTPEGSKIVSESGNTFTRSYIVKDAKTGKRITTISTSRISGLQDAAFSSDGSRLATHTDLSPGNKPITIWNLETGNKISDLDKVVGEITDIVFSPDGRTVAGCLLSNVENNVWRANIVMWDADSGQIKHKIVTDSAAKTELAIAPDGQTLAAGIGTDICLYDTVSTHSIGKMNAGKSTITALAFSPDGGRIAAGYEDGCVRLWDVKTHELLITMLGFSSAGNNKASQDWISYTADQRYDWSPGAESLIKWRYHGKLYPANAFADRLQRRQ